VAVAVAVGRGKREERKTAKPALSQPIGGPNPADGGGWDAKDAKRNTKSVERIARSEGRLEPVAVGRGREKREPPGAKGDAEPSAKFNKIPTKFFFLGVSPDESIVGVV